MFLLGPSLFRIVKEMNGLYSCHLRSMMHETSRSIYDIEYMRSKGSILVSVPNIPQGKILEGHKCHFFDLLC